MSRPRHCWRGRLFGSFRCQKVLTYLPVGGIMGMSMRGREVKLWQR